ncbi:MAG: hypothetical protein ACTTHG_02285 [Treponemataceae bacterium]
MLNKQLQFKGLYKLSDKIGPFLTWFLFLVYIMVVSIACAFFPVYVNLVFMVAIPILVLIFLKLVMFERLKLSTLIILRFLIILPVFNVFDGQIFVKLILAFLVINILEATFTDLLKNKMYFNFVTGLVLAAGVFILGGLWMPSGLPDSALSFIYRADLSTYSAGAGVFPKVSEPSTLVTVGTVLWVIAYTLWNWDFVIGEFSPSVAKLHLGILSAPIFLSFIMAGIYKDPTMIGGAWLMMRALTLTSGGVFQIAAKQFIEDKFRDEKLVNFIAKVKTNKVQAVLMIVNLLLLGGAFVIYFIA